MILPTNQGPNLAQKVILIKMVDYNEIFESFFQHGIDLDMTPGPHGHEVSNTCLSVEFPVVSDPAIQNMDFHLKFSSQH